MKNLEKHYSKQFENTVSEKGKKDHFKQSIKACSEQIIETCQLPKDVLLGAAIISMTDNQEIVIENFKNIIKYESKLLLIQGKRNRIQIIGRDLTLKLYSKEELKVCGHISEIKFL